MPADFFGILHALWQAMPSFKPEAAGLAIAALVLIVAWQWASPRFAKGQAWTQVLALIPGSVLALVLATLLVAWTDLPVETIGSKFGGIPSTLPSLQWPEFSWATVRFLIIPTTTLALLGAIESLLCARVADGMIDDRHDSNQELMAQGIANIVAPFFGGMPATGTIARTVTNIKSGGRSPIAGLMHALTLLLIVLVAAPLAKYVPLAAMAAILMFVAWNMGEWREFAHLRQFRMPYRITLLTVFFLTVVFDLTVAVEVGLFAACITFIYRISSLTRSEVVTPKDFPVLAGKETEIQAYRLYGALFFGAVKLIEEMDQHLPQRALVLDMKNVLYVDSSGADTLQDLHRSCAKQGVRLILCGLQFQPLDILSRCGLVNRLGHDAFYPTLNPALDAAVEYACTPH
jgi:SulP family sulfate permease